MILIMRILAQIIDILLYFFILIISFIFILPIFQNIITNSFLYVFIIFLFTIILYFSFQYPFYINRQTIGKAFFGLYIKSDSLNIKLNFTLIFVREIFLKLMSLYFVCIPILWGNKGLHEISTNTHVECLK